MNPKRKQFARMYEAEVLPKLEGMEIEFDEKVTLFPVELEETHDVVPKRSSGATRNGKSMR